MSDPIKNFTIPAVNPKPKIEDPLAIINAHKKSIEDEEMELLLRLQRIKAEKAELIRQQQETAKKIESEKEISIKVTALSGGIILIKNGYREDLIELLRNVPGRIYRGEGENGIPVGEWNSFLRAIDQQLKNVKIEYLKDTKNQINNHLNAPVWLVELEKRHLKLTPGPDYNTRDIMNVPGYNWNPEKRHFTVPLSEAWRLFESLEKVEGVLWTDEARDFTIKQVEMRGKLDAIALAKDWDYDVDLKNGIQLRPFQKVGCAFIEATGGKALLAYQMGLGKTFISLAYAIKNKYRTVIICPASLKNNWSREIYRLSGESPEILFGSSPSNFDIVNMLTSKKQFTIINYDIAGRRIEYDDVTKDQEGYEHINHKVKFPWIDLINMSKPDLVICDESHYIKNTDSGRSQGVRQITAPRIIHMTGTPVLNRPGELWPMLTMLSPETFPAEETFIKQYTYDGKSAKNVNELKDALKPIMIRRKQSDVVDDMPPLNRITEYHELSGKARKLYDKVMNGVYESIAAYSSSGESGGESSITSILARIQRLKMVCAIDKVDRTAELATELYDSASDDENLKHKKVLIFTQYKAVAFAIAQRLGNEALCFVSRGQNDFITADNNERDRLVQQFQTDESIHYLVVTEKTAKEGHNITQAGFVVFNDLFWTPAGHEQGEGRAYMRIGDPHGIDSYYTITDMNGDSIEEWIWELLQRKMNVIEQTVEGVESSRDTSIAMELINKMRNSMWTTKRR